MKKKLITLLLLTIVALTLCCCAEEQPSEPQPNEPQLADISGITFNNDIVTYDGNKHEIVINGALPEGAKVSYTNNSGTDTGTYNATAVITCEGYNTLTLSATLTINGKDFTGLSLDDYATTYDGTEHSIVVNGELPLGATVSYTNNKATNVGTYSTSAKITCNGYNDLTLDATLTINKADITGISFESSTITYDTKEHEIVVSGTLPSGTTATYSTNKGTDAGTYNATATITGSNYNTKELYATLTIEKATLTNITLTGDTVNYDAKEHSLQIVGNVPNEVSCTYTYDGSEVSCVTEVGSHEVKAVLTGKNYNTLTLTATLKIIAVEEMLYSTVFNGEVYFQNNLDDNKLYKYNGSKLVFVSSDIAHYFTQSGSNLYYYSSSLLNNNIVKFDGTTSTLVYNSGRATYLTTDGTNLYFAKANLVDSKNENGIYKVEISSEDAVATRICTDKASNIAYSNGCIYYVNQSNGNKLCKVSISSTDATGTVIIDSKVSELTCQDNALYYTKTVNGNAAIYKYIVTTNTETKLTNDNGAYLTRCGDYLYYVNKDLLTSNIYGKGIYKVSVYGGNSEKVLSVESDGGYYSLASDGTNIYYYKLNTKHFYKYVIDSQTETDLMAGFTPTEVTSLSGYATMTYYNNEIYYTNPLDSSSLYKYNLSTKAKYKVISDSVSNAYIHNNCLYYSTYVSTNFALWKLDLTDANAEPIKLSSHRYEQLIFTENGIYAIRTTAVGDANYIAKLDYETGTETIEYDDWNVHITSLELIGDKLVFNVKPTSVLRTGKDYIFVHQIGSSTTSATNLSIYSSYLTSNGSDTIYYYDHKAEALKSCNLSGSNVKTLVSNVTIDELVYSNGKLYYSEKSDSNHGLYEYNTTNSKLTKLSDKYVHGITIVESNVYYLNANVTFTADYASISSGDGKLYTYNTSTKVEIKLA